MKIGKSIFAKVQDKKAWHPYFAWLPTDVGDDRVWLEWIWRRYVPWKMFIGGWYQFSRFRPLDNGTEEVEYDPPRAQ